MAGGIRLVAAFEHAGTARILVHGLKYRGLTAYADLVVATVSPQVPRIPVVPIPRAWTRQIRYGIDPAREIARRLAVALDAPFLEVLRPPLHSRRRAGGDHTRPAPSFLAKQTIGGRFILVDDVVTTGATVRSAGESLGIDGLALVVAANVADRCLVS
jgi:predicted amidophosphoribosyltransferase